MATTKAALQKKVLAELNHVPIEYYPLLLQIIRTYRESVTLDSAAASFKRGWQEALRGEIFPIEQLWEDLDDE